MFCVWYTVPDDIPDQNVLTAGAPYKALCFIFSSIISLMTSTLADHELGPTIDEHTCWSWILATPAVCSKFSFVYATCYVNDVWCKLNMTPMQNPRHYSQGRRTINYNMLSPMHIQAMHIAMLEKKAQAWVEDCASKILHQFMWSRQNLCKC